MQMIDTKLFYTVDTELGSDSKRVKKIILSITLNK